jgi:Transposase, Mutator family
MRRWSPQRSAPSFAQPDAEHVRSRLDVIAGMLGRRFGKVETMLRESAADVSAFADFPVSHRKKVWSTKVAPDSGGRQSWQDLRRHPEPCPKGYQPPPRSAMLR